MNSTLQTARVFTPVFDLTRTTAHVGELAPLAERFDGTRTAEASTLVVGALTEASSKALRKGAYDVVTQPVTYVPALTLAADGQSVIGKALVGVALATGAVRLGFWGWGKVQARREQDYKLVDKYYGHVDGEFNGLCTEPIYDAYEIFIPAAKRVDVILKLNPEEQKSAVAQVLSEFVMKNSSFDGEQRELLRLLFLILVMRGIAENEKSILNEKTYDLLCAQLDACRDSVSDRRAIAEQIQKTLLALDTDWDILEKYFPAVADAANRSDADLCELQQAKVYSNAGGLVEAILTAEPEQQSILLSDLVAWFEPSVSRHSRENDPQFESRFAALKYLADHCPSLFTHDHTRTLAWAYRLMDFSGYRLIMSRLLDVLYAHLIVPGI